MIDPDRNRQREHWKAIAEQLGLSTEPETVNEAPAAQPSQAPAASQAEPVVEASRLAEPAYEPVAEPLPPRDRSHEFVAEGRAAVEPEAAAPAPLEDKAEAAQPAVQTEADEPRPPAKRGRRRRSGRSKSAEPDAASAEPAAVAAEPGGDEDERPERRDRGRGRNRKVSKSRSGPDAPAAAARPRREHPEDEELTPSEHEEIAELSAWKVPSWNDLIASLYRPER